MNQTAFTYIDDNAKFIRKLEELMILAKQTESVQEFKITLDYRPFYGSSIEFHATDKYRREAQ